MGPLPKTLELRIRKAINKVHERKLAESLEPVEEALRKWHDGEGTIFQVNDAMHQHQMRAKRFWGLYANTAATSLEVPYIMEEALRLGLISPAEFRQLSEPPAQRRRHRA